MRNFNLEVGKELKKIEERLERLSLLTRKVVDELGSDSRTFLAILAVVDVLVEKGIIEGSEFTDAYMKNLSDALEKNKF